MKRTGRGRILLLQAKSQNNSPVSTQHSKRLASVSTQSLKGVSSNSTRPLKPLASVSTQPLKQLASVSNQPLKPLVPVSNQPLKPLNANSPKKLKVTHPTVQSKENVLPPSSDIVSIIENSELILEETLRLSEEEPKTFVNVINGTAPALNNISAQENAAGKVNDTFAQDNTERTVNDTSVQENTELTVNDNSAQENTEDAADTSLLNTNGEVINESTSLNIAVEVSEAAVLEIPENELTTFLEPKTDGKGVINFFLKNGRLNDPKRKVLADIIIRDALDADPNRKLDSDFFRNVTDLILEAFPNEQGHTYYIPSICVGKSKKSPGGRLYNKYTNLCKKYVKDGSRQLCKMSESDSISTENPDAIDDETYGHEINWLMQMITPWTLVTEKWKITASKRLHEYSTENVEISAYIEKFPCLKLTDASELFEIDFDVNYKAHKNCLYEVWPHLRKSILDYAVIKIQETPSFAQAVENCPLIDLSCEIEAEKDITALFLLLHLIPIGTNTLGKRKTKDSNDNSVKNIARASRTELIDGFVLNIPVATDLKIQIKDRLDMLEKRKIRCQSFIVISGDQQNRSFIVYFNGQEYFVNNILAAVDICFKIYMTFEAKYPPETIFVWTFFQKYIYNISTPHDIRSSSLCTLAGELELL